MLNLLIIGGGNLGFRYAQGIMRLNKEACLTIVDKSFSRLEFLKNTFAQENMSLPINLEFLTEINKKRNFDVAIISTNSDVRYEIFNEYSNKQNVEFWILEKVLTSSLDELSLFPKNNNIWVNTFLRSLKIFKYIKNTISKSNIKIYVSGGNWGLACNSIHYIDLISWMFNSSPNLVNIDRLDDEWFSSKRKGFYEVNGTLYLEYPDNVTLTITSDFSENDLIILFESDTCLYSYNLINGEFKKNGILDSIILIPYQSDMTKDIINEIINTKRSSLTPISESIEMHKLFLRAMGKSWKRSNFKNKGFHIT